MLRMGMPQCVTGLILGFLLSGCGNISRTDINSPQIITDLPVITTSPSQNPQITPTVLPVDKKDDVLSDIFPDFKLQPITIQNVSQIVPVALLDDSGLYNSTLSADGKYYAKNTTYRISVYNTYTGESIASFPTNGATRLAFSPDAARLAGMYTRRDPSDPVVLRTDKSGSSYVPERYKLTVWDLSTKTVMFSKNAEDLCGEKTSYPLFHFLDDGSLALVSLNFDTHVQSVCRVSGQDGTVLDRLDFAPSFGYVRSLALSLDGTTLAAAFSSGPTDYLNPVLAAFRFPDGQVLFKKPVQVMPNLAFIEPEHQLLYNSKNADGQISIEIINSSGDLLRSIPVSTDPIFPIRPGWFAANDRTLVIPGEIATIGYDLPSGDEIFRIPYAKQADTIFPVLANSGGNSQFFLARSSNVLLIHQNCSMIACSNMDDMLRIIDLTHPDADLSRVELPFWFAMRTGGDLSPDGQMAAISGLWNGDVRVWSTQNGQQIMLLQGHQGVVYQAVFSADNSLLATVSADGTARLWDARKGDLLHILSGHQGAVLRVAFSPNGTHLITSAEDNTMRLWDVASGEELRSFSNPKPEYVISGLWFTSETTLLFKAVNLKDRCLGCQSTAYLLNFESGVVTELFWEHLAVATAPDGTWLLHTGSGDYRVLRIGRMVEGQWIEEQSILLTDINHSLKIALSPDGKLIYSENANGLNVIDRATGEQVALAANYLGLTSDSGRLEASADGRFLLDFTGNIVLWGIPE